MREDDNPNAGIPAVVGCQHQLVVEATVLLGVLSDNGLRPLRYAPSRVICPQDSLPGATMRRALSDSSFFCFTVGAGYWQGMVPVSSWHSRGAGLPSEVVEGSVLMSGLRKGALQSSPDS